MKKEKNSQICGNNFKLSSIISFLQKLFNFFARFFLFLLFIGLISPETDSKEVSCTFLNIKYEYFKRTLRTCFIQDQGIDDVGSLISTPIDATIESFSIKNANQAKKVEFIPENIAEKFPQVIAIGIYECAVKLICENNFKNLRKLKYLNLGENLIKTVDKNSFKDLVELEMLSLNNNQIEYLSEHIFSSLSKLKLLFLGKNQIEILNPKVFDSLVNLEMIQLSENKLQFVHPKTFEKMVNAKNISLTGNMIEEISPKTFTNNKKLEWIWLGNNKIKSIDYNLFNDLSTLKYVEMRNNTCINEFYHKQFFEVMKTDLRQNCVTLTHGELKGVIGNYQEKLISVAEGCSKNEIIKCQKPPVIVDNTSAERLAACESQKMNETAQINALKQQVDSLNNKIRLLTKL